MKEKQTSNQKTDNTQMTNSSFLIKLRYSQNNSLQGSVQWIEKNTTIHFRSLCELNSLLKEAGELEYRTWICDEESQQKFKNTVNR